MQKSRQVLLAVIILVFLIIISTSLFLYNKNNTKFTVRENNIKDQQKEVSFLLDIEPALLDWEESTNSAQWTKRDSHGFVVFRNKIWLMGGVDGTTRMVSPGNVDYGNSPHFSDVWYSNDGINWELALEKAPWGKRRSATVADFKNKMWLMGGWGPEIGCKNDIWSSEDGAKWKLEELSANWPQREGHQLLVFQNKLWLIGGVNYTKGKVFNDVWYSENGVDWNVATKNAEFSPRWDFATTIFKDKIWITGGMNLDQEMFNDVWYSENGVDWKIATTNPPFSTRQGALINYSDKLWVIGRLDDITNKGVNDVWYSENGVDWQKTKNDPLWTGREDFGAVVFKDKIWIFGGMDKNWTWKNDVWHSSTK